MSAKLEPRRRWLALVAALALAAPVAAQDSPAKKWPRTMHACRYYGQLDGFGGMLHFDTLFEEDGSVFSENAKWSLDTRPINDLRRPPLPSIVEPSADGRRPESGFVIIEWPNDNSWDRSPAEPADAKATVRFSSFGLLRQSMREKERWHQTVIARNSETLVYGEGDDRGLLLSPLEPVLISDYGSKSNMDLRMPVANLLAWGSGLQMLTVYDVFVEPRQYRRNSSPNGPAGRMRIVGEYRINVRVLSAAFDAMRVQYRAWRDSLRDVKATCETTEVNDPSRGIIVT